MFSPFNLCFPEFHWIIFVPPFFSIFLNHSSPLQLATHRGQDMLGRIFLKLLHLCGLNGLFQICDIITLIQLYDSSRSESFQERWRICSGQRCQKQLSSHLEEMTKKYDHFKSSIQWRMPIPAEFPSIKLLRAPLLLSQP